MRVHRGQCFSCCRLRPIGKSLNQLGGLQTALKKKKKAIKTGQNISVCIAQPCRSENLLVQLCFNCAGGCVFVGLCTKL